MNRVLPEAMSAIKAIAKFITLKSPTSASATMNILSEKLTSNDVQVRERTFDWLEVISGVTLRYGIVLILVWIGLMKFTAYESEGIRPFVENSPPFAWTYSVFGVQGMSNILGVVEIAIAILIAMRPWAPKVSALGSLAAAGMFLSTISFLVTTPQAWLPETGPFAISVPGQFLLKDVVLLGASLWSLSEALKATQRRR
jgi:uncharacterized membrane protein YkgB